METSKQKAIREAYGKAWDKIDLSVQENILKNIGGWTYEINESWLISTMKIELELKNQYCRPKSLQGIETNNGWIRIESEADLPSEDYKQDYYVFKFSNQYKIIRKTYKQSEVKDLWGQEEITHYQPIIKPLKPIY